MKLIFKLISIILISVSLVGCWGAREPSQISIVTALGIDKEDENYLVTVQILNPGSIALSRNSEGTPVTTYRMEGKTIEEAVRRLSLEIPRNIFLGHLRLLVFGEDLAREGIGKTLDYLLRNTEIRSDFYLTVVKGEKATEALNILTPLERIPANKIFFSLEVSEKIWAATASVKLFQFIETLQKEGAEPILTSIFVHGNSDVGMNIENIENVDVPSNIQIGPIAAFKGDKLIGWLNDPQSTLINILIGDSKGFLIMVPWEDPNEFVNLSTEKLSRKVIVEEVMGKPKIKVDIKIKASITEAMGIIPVDKPATVTQIEKKTEEYLKLRFSKSTTEIQTQFQTDIFGFGEIIKNERLDLWKSISKDWNKVFPTLPVEYNVKVEVTGTGTTTKSLKPSH
ncbi:Ger(x)C family spore germination protein [Clostridium sp. YIM B02505]|uniref:Ger(X)C family spore germination protein n=1 Tax=Clostridium yunnanense TaxID=2800325 RepID=A0ABS1ELW1_9CLOT|nr:Ger(x)C family spore germination protein [Clostridium yunnanense]MBK1810347.1 Ger(x)C family spore germination protein [Clostridium yunnanense]